MALLTDITETERQFNGMMLEGGGSADRLTGEGDKLDHSSASRNAQIQKPSFDKVIGCIEDLLVDEHFHTLQSQFLEKYWEEFEEGEENKHSYMAIFKQYTDVIEDYMNSYLKKKLPTFSMDSFTAELEQKKNLDGEVFEVLLTLTDFNAFKEMFLEYRQMKEGAIADLTSAINITSLPTFK